MRRSGDSPWIQHIIPATGAPVFSSRTVPAIVPTPRFLNVSVARLPVWTSICCIPPPLFEMARARY
jgi:hypothetical protein